MKNKDEYEVLINDAIRRLIDGTSAPTYSILSSRNYRLRLISLVPIFCLIGLLVFYLHTTYNRTYVSSEQFRGHLNEDRVKSVIVKSNELLVLLQGGESVSAKIDDAAIISLLPELLSKNIVVSFASQTWTASLPLYFIAFGLGGVTFLYARYMLLRRQNIRQSYRPIRPSYSWLGHSNQKRYTFKDVVIPEPTAERLRLYIDYIKEPQKFMKLGGILNRGFLLVGPPGIGKSTLARAIAGEANVPIFGVSAHELIGDDLTAGPLQIRDLYEQAKKNAPSFIFIDDIERIATSMVFWPDPLRLGVETAYAQLLAEMDIINPSDGVIIYAATSRPDLLDENLINPARLEVIELPYLTVTGTEKIFKILTRRVPLGEDVDVSELARRLHQLTPNITVALAQEVINRAVQIAGTGEKKIVIQLDFIRAIEAVTNNSIDSNK